MTYSKSTSFNSNAPALSVLLPIRPHPVDLGRVLRSINSQSFDNWEIVVLLDRDDGSNKNTVIEKISCERIVFVDVDISLEGFAGALNRGVGYCNGEYIARCDDDDLSAPTRFEQQVRILESNPLVAVVTGWAEVVNTCGTLIRVIQHPTEPVQLMRALCKSNIFPHSATTFRKDAFIESGGYQKGMDGCEDYELWLKMATKGELASTGTYLISYLDNPEGMSRWKLEKHQLKEIRIAQRRLLKRLRVPFLLREINIGVSRIERVGAKLKSRLSF